jgi:hypothetical protein
MVAYLWERLNDSQSSLVYIELTNYFDICLHQNEQSSILAATPPKLNLGRSEQV